MVPENADEALMQWQAIGQRVKSVRHSMRMSPMMFAQELETSSLNINLIENLLKCDMVLLRDIKVLADEMRWLVLLKQISQKYNVSEKWLLTGQNNGSMETIGKNDSRDPEREIVITVPLMIDQSMLIEGIGMIVNYSNCTCFGKNVYYTIDVWLYHILTDIFRLYFQEMSNSGRSDIAQETIEAMLNIMKRHPSYHDTLYYENGKC